MNRSSVTAARNKTAGRVVLGPRLVKKECVRIVALADGSGNIEMYDKHTASWRDAAEWCSFREVWSAPAAADPTPY
jgi:hypothetical protein